MDEMGVNALRTAHYQQDRHVYDLADERGYLVWAEIPLVNSITDTPVPKPVRQVAGRVDFADHARQFVTKSRRRRDHLRMITAFENFQIGPAGKRRLNIDSHFAGLKRSRGHLLDFDLFFAVENCGFHFGTLADGWRSVQSANRRGTQTVTPPGCRDKFAERDRKSRSTPPTEP